MKPRNFSLSEQDQFSSRSDDGVRLGWPSHLHKIGRTIIPIASRDWR